MENRKIFIASVVLIMASTMYVFSDTRVKFRSRDNGTVYTKMVDSGNTLSGSTVYYPYMGEVQTIETEHYKIEAGDHYYESGFATLGSGDSITFTMTAPASPTEIHLRFTITGTQNTEVYVLEGVTVVGGTTITPENNNRISSNVSSVTLVSGATITGGTTIDSYSVGISGSTPAKTGQLGSADKNDEMILAYSESYSFKIKSTAAANIISYKGTWYED